MVPATKHRDHRLTWSLGSPDQALRSPDHPVNRSPWSLQQNIEVAGSPGHHGPWTKHRGHRPTCSPESLHKTWRSPANLANRSPGSPDKTLMSPAHPVNRSPGSLRGLQKCLACGLIPSGMRKIWSGLATGNRG
jgi:hypothetical protein